MSYTCQTKDRQLTDKCQIGVKMDRITIRLPPQQIELLEKLVETGEFPTISEAVRYAVREYLSKRGDRIMRDSDQISTFDARL
ncbi:hypothetical protein SDC9_25395 [bioreactor metagenome]|uniref:Ribbon-helix-helix protein CopG domain-containing protein n=1 Tax=bioreactor metagenome TaxID=1076179 RepID=A0A644ULB3_9ZZZZ